MPMSADFNHIKQWLDPQLKQMGLSVEAFANRCELTRAAVYFYRNDKNRPDEQTMIRMCRVLGVPAEEGLAQYSPKRTGRPARIRSSPKTAQQEPNTYVKRIGTHKEYDKWDL